MVTTEARRRPRRRLIVTIVALLSAAAMAAASGYLAWSHQQVQADRQNRAEFAAAAKQVAITLMSVDADDPESGVQRILDNAVDPFRAEFASAADDFVRVSQDAKVTTKATADAAAVKSVDDDSAVVLVAATSTVTDAEGVAEPPRSWRLSVDLRRDGDRIKMSSVEFLS
ncbi:hypothetical protein CRI77_16740 [Mycolicibacterium duvalii]|nr:hypothetical protein [Mycolicibacterium duvalii]PEG39271.1 hypothetical protein CRI77_16740 [Mycolicibacterium duvalii]